MPDLPAASVALDIHFPELSHRLLTWFFENKRELPWREEHDPYRIWVSEVMLQQTRSDSAAQYYRHWLSLFPTLGSLAAAGLEEVLKAWEGLGYYSRARNLHRAARIVLDKWGGQFPETEEQLRTLPGIGEYTAAALLSIAFAKALGVVDGNVLRVVSRLLAEPVATGLKGVEAPGAHSSVPRGLKKLARKFVEASFLRFHPGWVNQAWMELGALICLPKPLCPRCPLSYTCRAHRENRIAEFPPRVASRPLPIRRESLLVLLPGPIPQRLREELARTGGDDTWEPAGLGELLRLYSLPLILVRRADSGLLGGLWELPNFPQRGQALVDRLTPLEIEILVDPHLEVQHHYSHFEIRFQSFVAELGAERKLDPWIEQRRVQASDLGSYPRPKVHISAMRLFGLLEES